ncbi:hypothetical protein Q0601_15005 [Paracoccus onubensis]|uniref:hypothetical protein n=1 Tax=Paracoccus onubensis TaxID=1675788 RepID=UPI0027310041|nr:hypothetical protein [Paracoccus onubensis]MDP0928493.1 hypothetical protein [Paracoccus onubensis]
MPLNIRVPNPQDYARAVLPHIPTIGEIIENVPNLLGLWHASTASAGVIATLDATFGTAVLNSAGGSNSVTRGTVDDTPVVTFGGPGDRLVSTWDDVAGEASVMVRFYIRESSADFQNIYGPSGGRLLFRSNQTFHWSAQPLGGDITGMAPSAPVVGWHSAEIYYATDAVHLVIDGNEYTAPRTADMNPNIMFGNNAAVGDNTSVAIASMFACNSNIYGTEEATALRAYLFG